MLLSGPRGAGILAKGQEEIRAIRSIQTAEPAEETGSKHTDWTDGRGLSASPGLSSSEGPSGRWCGTNATLGRFVVHS